MASKFVRTWTRRKTIGLTLSFSKLHDVTNYLSDSLLDAPAKKVQIKKTNFAHQKSGL